MRMKFSSLSNRGGGSREGVLYLEDFIQQGVMA